MEAAIIVVLALVAMAATGYALTIKKKAERQRKEFDEVATRYGMYRTKDRPVVRLEARYAISDWEILNSYRPDLLEHKAKCEAERQLWEELRKYATFGRVADATGRASEYRARIDVVSPK